MLPSPLLTVWNISLTLPFPLLDILHAFLSSTLYMTYPVHPSLSFTHTMELDSSGG